MNQSVKSYQEVKEMLKDASSAWEKLVGHIRYYYVMDEKWVEGKPTHKHRNNLYIRRSGKSFVILSIREGYFEVCVVLGKDERVKFEEQRTLFSTAICQEYDNAHTYHDGKWLGFEVREESQVDDIIRLIHLKRKPNRKELPVSLERCGCLDLGLSSTEITDLIVSK